MRALSILLSSVTVTFVVSRETTLPIINISSLVNRVSSGGGFEVQETIAAIGRACEEIGFFYVVGHGVSESLQRRLDLSSRRFFALPMEAKRDIAMSKGGKAWRGYFSVGEEVTSGVVDQKEGIYFGQERNSLDPRPLHGANLFPGQALGERRSVAFPLSSVLEESVHEYMDEMTKVRMGKTK
jgi:isopenicillin N synthase-like dioxygenase